MIEVKKTWTTATGLPAAIILNDLGFHCGYVGVPPNHPWHGLHYTDTAPNTESSKRIEDIIEVHGGLTFSSHLVIGVPAPVLTQPPWWFGYDCGHLGDKTGIGADGVFRDLSYCTTQCEGLAKQLAEVTQVTAPTVATITLPVALMRAVLPILQETATHVDYGCFRTENPHDFCPDMNNTPDEHAAHKAACKAYDRGEYVDNHHDGWIAPGVHVTKAPWGVGTYTYKDPEIMELIQKIKEVLGERA